MSYAYLSHRGSATLLFFCCFLLCFFLPTEILRAQSVRTLRIGYPAAVERADDDDSERLLYDYTHDYLDEIARYTSWQYVFVPVSPKQIEKALLQGEIDLYFPAERISSEQQIIYSDAPIASTMLSLYTRDDDVRLAANPLPILSGRTIGVLDNPNHREALQRFLTDQGINLDVRVFHTHTELLNALHQNVVDVIVDNGSHENDHERKIFSLGLTPAYIAAAPQNADLIEAIDNTNWNIETNEPDFLTHLRQKYYNKVNHRLTYYTQEELAFMKGLRPLRVVYVPHRLPYSDKSALTSRVVGIYPDVLRAISDATGMKFEFIPASNNNDAMNMIKNGQADLFFCIYNNIPQNEDVTFTSIFFTENFTYVTKRESPNIKEGTAVVALPTWFYGTKNYLLRMHPHWQIYLQATPRQSLEELSNGKADLALVPTLSLRESGDLVHYPNITDLEGEGVQFPIRLAISPQVPNPQLLESVLSKAVLGIKESKLQEIVNAHTIEKLSAYFLLTHYQPQVLLLLCLFMGLLGLALYLYLHWRYQRKRAALLLEKNAQLEELVREQKILVHARNVYKKKSEVDGLTGLLNKRAMQAVCESAFTKTLAPNTFHAFVIMDLDHFKEVNDSYGHQYGDRVLKHFARDIQGLFRETDFIGRFGGDEFVVLMRNLKTRTPLIYHLRQILTIAQELEIRNDRSLMSASIGVALFPTHGAGYEEIFQAADSALYDVKRKGRNGYRIYTPTLHLTETTTPQAKNTQTWVKDESA